MAEKKKNAKQVMEYDENASFSAGILRVLLFIVLVGLGIIFAINTFGIVYNPISYKKAQNNNRTVEMIENTLNDDSVVFSYDDWTKEKVDNFIDEQGNKMVFKYIMYERVAVEVCIVFLFIIISKAYDFLSVKNLKDPFSDKSINTVKQIINLSLILFFINLIFTSTVDLMFEPIGSAKILSILNISLALIFGLYVFKYILEIAQKKINKVN